MFNETGSLSVRQLQIFRLIVQGHSNKEIAEMLNVSQGTVKGHVNAIFAKLGVRRRSALAIAGARYLAVA